MGPSIPVHSLMQNVAQQSNLQSPQHALSSGNNAAGVHFSTLMNRSSEPPSVASSEGSETVSKLILDQQSELDGVLNDMDRFQQLAPTMSASEMTAASVKLTAEFASMNFDMSTKLSIVNSSKSALETLMKEG